MVTRLVKVHHLVHELELVQAAINHLHSVGDRVDGKGDFNSQLLYSAWSDAVSLSESLSRLIRFTRGFSVTKN